MIKYFSLISLLILSLVSCTNEFENIFTGGEVTTINVSAQEFQSATRTTIDNTNYSVKWSDGDVIGIFPMVDESSQIAFKIKEGSGSSNASFDGKGWGLKNDVSYAAYYPAQNNIELNKESILLDYNGQKQNGNNNTAHLSKYDFMSASASNPTNRSASFNFKHLGTLLHFQFTIPEAAELTSIILKTNGEFANKAILNLTTNQVNITTNNDAQTLELENVSVAANGVLDAYMMIAAVNLTGKTLEATVTSVTGDAYVTELTAQNFVGGDFWNYFCSLAKTYSGTYLGHEYVDLGITDDNGNKVLWATTNVGANNPWEYGGYYAWGETKAYDEIDISNFHNYEYTGNTYEKTVYTYNTYKWATGDNWSTITKYSFADELTQGLWYENNIYRGLELDGYKAHTQLDPEDDAATVNWGAGWRMPTISELGALITNCYCKWVDNYNGHTVNGIIIYKAKLNEDKGKFNTSNSEYSLSDPHIFLPSAGVVRGINNNLYSKDSAGYYSSSKLRRNSYIIDLLFFANNEIDYADSGVDRTWGLSVRPIYIKQN